MPGSMIPSLLGIVVDAKSQYILLNCDRTAALMASIITLKSIINKSVPLRYLVPSFIIAVIGLMLPEIVSGLYSSGNHISIIPKILISILNPHKYQIHRYLEYAIYLIGHCLWHGYIFHISNMVSSY